MVSPGARVCYRLTRSPTLRIGVFLALSIRRGAEWAPWRRFDDGLELLCRKPTKVYRSTHIV
jgi:hypothetical protein